MYYIYMLRCEDNSIYTGITIDLERRMKEHFNKDDKCAKYTLNRTARKLEIAWETEDRKLASKLEYYLKQLSKKDKEELIQNVSVMSNLLDDKIDCSKYKINYISSPSCMGFSPSSVLPV
ncbi:MAG: GIY-YIG nuclease family protein [Oscillospiraceae bacterium]|nr:GIY-YIG nuclease family protein [Oscillospiraceae bacterium]